MCHPEVPAGQVTPEVAREEVQVPLLNGEKMPGLLARPEGGRGPAIIIVHDIFGRSPFYEDLAARLATAGFTALCPDYFFRQGAISKGNRDEAFARRAKVDERQTIQDLIQAVDWLGERAGDTEKMGTVGFCMGGTLVLDMAAERSNLVTVCFYGFPAGGGPQTPDKKAPAPLDQLDRIHGPILGFWGDQDTGVGMDNVEKLDRGLRERNVPFEHTIFPGLGHGFLAASRLDPDHEAYEMACQAWTRAVELYRRHLGARTLAVV